MDVNKVNFAAAQEFQFFVNIAQCEVIRVVHIHKHIQVTIVILLATSDRPENAYSSDAKLLGITVLILPQFLKIICRRPHCHGF